MASSLTKQREQEYGRERWAREWRKRIQKWGYHDLCPYRVPPSRRNASGTCFYRICLSYI